MGKDDILVFCAHAEDQVLGAGGTIAKYAKEGKKVRTFVVNSGGSVHHLIKREHIAKRETSKESSKANEILKGKELKFLEDEDLIKLLKKYKPGKIFTHSEKDPTPAHRNVSKLVKKSVLELDLNCEVYAFFQWGLHRMKIKYYPKLFVDISETYDAKEKALKCYESQKLKIMILKLTMKFKAALNGLKNNTKYAEVFYKVR